MRISYSLWFAIRRRNHFWSTCSPSPFIVSGDLFACTCMNLSAVQFCSVKLIPLFWRGKISPNWVMRFTSVIDVIIHSVWNTVHCSVTGVACLLSCRVQQRITLSHYFRILYLFFPRSPVWPFSCVEYVFFAERVIMELLRWKLGRILKCDCVFMFLCLSM